MPVAVRIAGVIWGVGGIAGLLVYAALSLERYTLGAISGGLSPFEWLLFTGNGLFMAWVEGYRGFQQRFSPRVAARALHLYQHPTPWRLGLAPLFCAGYFAATPRLARTIWIGTGLIVVAVILFNELQQPWRGILDGGVLVGLAWGIVSLLAATGAMLRQRRGRVPAEIPADSGL